MYDALLIMHFIGLALGVGTGFAMMRLGIATRDLSPEERGKFFGRAAVLGKNGTIGLTMLLMSGVGMMLRRGPAEVLAWGGTAFHVKLGLVAVLVGLAGYMHALGRKVGKEGGGPALMTLAKLGRVSLPLGLAIVVLAVLAFH